MILYFNKNGQLLENLEYGSSARVGTTTFKIFAYFEDLDDYSEYSTAMIRFKKPDIQGSEYPDLFMVQQELNYAGSDAEYFKSEDNPYNGFEFDFDKVSSNGNKVKLLDVPGMWEATITLYKSEDSSYVTGLVRFYVEGAVYEDDDELYDADINVVISNIRNLLIEDYVPYEGANDDVFLGSHDITANQFLITGWDMGLQRYDRDLLMFNYDGHLSFDSDEVYFIASYLEIGGDTKINGYVQASAIKFDDDGYNYINLNLDNDLVFSSGTGNFIFEPDGSAVFNCDVYVWHDSLRITEDSQAPKMVAKNNYGNDTVENTTWSFYTEETEEVAETVHFASKEWVKPSIPKFQSGVAIIRDLTTNINGWVLSNYGYEEVTISTYSAYKITTSGGETLTEAQARTYMRCMSGSDFLPTYDFSRPMNSFFITAAGKILKPQFDNSNGLLLFVVNEIVSKDYVVDNYIPYVGANHYVDLGNEQFQTTGMAKFKDIYSIGSNTNAPSSSSANSARIVLTNSFAQGLNLNYWLGSLEYKDQTLQITSYSKSYKVKKAGGFKEIATEDYVDNIVNALKRNSYRKVDVTTYPTLNDFLASTGEEGYVYLYPINTSDLSQGYYQYIWEDDAWMDLGTSNVDLSGYATIDYVSDNYATTEDLQEAIATALGTVEEELDALDVGEGVA